MTQKKHIFISHAGADVKVKNQDGKEILHPALSRLINSIDANIFLSSDPKRGLGSADKLLPAIQEHVKQADVCLVFVTDNFLRSHYCIYELCLIQALNKKEVHFFYANEAVRQSMPEGLGDNASLFHYLSAGTDEIIKHIFAKRSQLSVLLKKVLPEFEAFLQYMAGNDSAFSLTPCSKPYIGQTGKEREAINGYLESIGIRRMAASNIYSKKELAAHVNNAHDVYCVSTTGAGLLKSLKEDILPKALLKEGFVFHMLIPPRDSQFCNDVAKAECSLFQDNEIINIQNKKRIYNEYEASIQYLNEAYLKAQMLSNGEVKGKILIHNSLTLLRQTILITEESDTIWGWLSATMPPLRSIDSPDILFECSTTGKKKQLGQVVLEHCRCLAEMAGEGYPVNGHTLVEDIEDANDMHLIDAAPYETYWLSLFENAMPADPEGLTLIEIAAQHPLTDGRTPNKEFAARLDEAIRIYRQLKAADNKRIVKLYVPGSQHCENEQCDTISLSEAGITYLRNQLTESEQRDILSDEETNIKYMKQHGVYNSMDECYVASCVFKDMLSTYNYKGGQLLCICSPNQVMRKTFIYLRYGIEAMCYSAPVPGKIMFHNPVKEYFISLRNIIYNCSDWQNVTNEQYQLSRSTRKPK